METRLIIAYSLIAIIVALTIFGGIMLSKRQEKSRRRNSGKRDYQGEDLSDSAGP